MNENNEMEIFDKEKRFEKMIPVTNVVFREAWEIGINDQDCAAILPNDDPIIPEEYQHDAPVLKLMEEKNKRK